MRRREFITLVGAAAAAGSLGTWPITARAQQNDYPDHAVRIVIGFGPGGGTDTVARIVAQKLQETLGGAFVVENRPGGSGRLAPDLVAKSTPDGYTLLGAAPGAMSVGAAIWPDIPYDIFKDFAPISLIADYTLVVLVAKPIRPEPSPNWSPGSKPIPTRPTIRRPLRCSRCRSSTSRSKPARRRRRSTTKAATS